MYKATLRIHTQLVPNTFGIAKSIEKPTARAKTWQRGGLPQRS